MDSCYYSLKYTHVITQHTAPVPIPFFSAEDNSGPASNARPPDNAIKNEAAKPIKNAKNTIGFELILLLTPLILCEYFVLKNPQSNVFVSPILEEKPEFLVKGKALRIDLKNKLKEEWLLEIRN